MRYFITNKYSAGFTLMTICCVFLFLSFPILASAQDVEEEIKPHEWTDIKSIIIKENGAWTEQDANEETSEVCKAFMISEEEVKDFFLHSHSVSSSQYKNIRSSNCYAAGEITFANGDSGQWQIDLRKRGGIILRDGRKLYFYCNGCRSKAFDPNYNEGDPYEYGDKTSEPRPYKLTEIKSIVIKENGAWEPCEGAQTPEVCKNFRITKKEVKKFLRLADRVGWDEYDDPTYIYPSSCYTAGKIVFANGDRGQWRIDFERRGVITLQDGRKLYFYCSRCRSKAFYP
jgi:hypothetical protein